jgi:hypothetical protein
MPGRSRTLGLYLFKSFGWLVALAAWPLLVGPRLDPHCLSAASFGFLPALMVVPFLLLVVYLLGLFAHIAFEFVFWQRGILLGRTAYVASAVFFLPYALLSIPAMLWALRWNASALCFAMTVVLLLPALLTPLVNAALFGRPRRGVH